MATSFSIPRFLAPRLASVSRVRVRPGQILASKRNASDKSSKPRVLEKPEKFNPPSHPQRLKRQTPRHYGPELTAQEQDTQRSKQYPNMMPPDGSFMHWFLTNKSIHIWITLSVLTSLTVFTISTDFKRRTPYVDMLPTWSYVFSYPFAGIGQVFQVYRLETNRRTQEAADKRKQSMEEAKKRKVYRVAHGLESAEEGLQLDNPRDLHAAGAAASVVDSDASDASPIASTESETYVDFEGNRKPVKKWLGIW